jgi:ABC-type transporter MlaC component
MKKILVAVMGMLCATALVVNAQDATTTTKPVKKKLTAEQQTLQKEMLAKYDTDKNGKLNKAEQAKMSKEDKDKMTKAGLLKAPKKATDAAPAASATPAH